MGDGTANPYRRGGSWMLAAAWLLIIGGFYWYFSGWTATQNNPNSAAVVNAQQGDLMLVRNRVIDFASGALVFPGGKVDADDRDARWTELAPPDG